MQKTSMFISFLFISFSLLANETHHSFTTSLYDHMVSINKEWKTQEHKLDHLLKMQTSFETDDDRIQMHLMLVETVLRNRSTEHLSTSSSNQRLENLESLLQYWKDGQFPTNTNHQQRQPYFIDVYGTACAVGHLLQTDGQEALAQRISLEQNYAFIRELNYPQLGSWATENGFETSELAWIQPAYFPNAGYEECPAFQGGQMNLDPNNKINVIKPIGPVSIGGGALYIGGDFQLPINGATVNSVALFNGVAYVDLGIDITGEVKDIIEFENSVIIVGDFQDQQSNATNIIKYNRNDGSYIGLQTGPMGGSINTAEVLDCVLFVGGDFTSIDGNSFANLAAYTTVGGWSNGNVNGCTSTYFAPITVNGPVNDLTIANGSLIVGGDFTQNGSMNALGGLSFYSATGWNSPTLDPSIPFTSVDHLNTTTANDLLIGSDNLIGYNFTTSSFIQGGCLGPVYIPANTGKIDALMKTEGYHSSTQLLYRSGNLVHALEAEVSLNGAVGIEFFFDQGGEINTLASYGSGAHFGYYVGGRFTNQLLGASRPSGWCYEYSYYGPSLDLTPNNGAIYKFVWNEGFPVELTSFDATLIDNQEVDLAWQTHTEHNSSHYDIERSTTGDENSFVKIGEVDAAGNSIEVINYKYTDRLNVSAKYIYYRLKIVDEDGSFEYSEIRVIKLNAEDVPEIKLYPNPAKDEITISATFAYEGATDIQILNLQGMIVKEINDQANNSFLTTTIDVSDLSSGIYFVKIVNGMNKNNRLVTKFQKAGL